MKSGLLTRTPRIQTLITTVRGSTFWCQRQGDKMMPAENIDRLCIDTIRTLSMDAVQQANSGHPGTPMALAPVEYTLWQKFLRYDPNDPLWPNRDRFVLSCGHASMLLYSMLHLSGVKAVGKSHETPSGLAVPLEDIKRFRQLGSKCPGHPESHLTSGVETTTGPLGQGVGNSVGMAIASRWLATTYNRPGFDLFDFKVYALCSDGDMMEGISHEAASIAGHLRLNNLCWIYDNNHITIEGKTSLTFDEDVGMRFQAYGWNVHKVPDANDLGAIQAALQKFQNSDRPTMIIVTSHIAWGAPHKQDTHSAHGEPLGEDEVRATKRFYGWPEDAKFLVPDGVREHFASGVGKRGRELRDAWMAKYRDYAAKYPDLANQLTLMQKRELPQGWDAGLPSFPADPKGKATRESSGEVLNALAKNVPWLLGGAADLAPSTKTNIKGAGDFEANNYGARNFHFGIREHAMGAILNGMSLSNLRPFGAGFLIFSSYGRMPIRLAALMEIPVIYVFTHDSIGVGEDGPTHQPIEQLAALRSMPQLLVIRPVDANEVVEAWKVVMPLKHEPALLILSRQALPTLDRTKYASASGLAKGAYVLADAPGGKPDVLLLATGSEVSLCVSAYERLTAEGVKARVVSMPCWELFDRQSEEYRNSVLPPTVSARVGVEMASPFGWSQYVGMQGTVIAMRTFGASAPVKDLQKHFGFTADAVYAAAKDQLKRTGKK
jgi:transketolase